MTNQEKDLLKLRFGMAIMKKIEENQILAESNKKNGVGDNQVVDSLRKLEFSSGVPYASIHEITKGTRNASFTTLSALIDGLDLRIDEFFSNYYYKIADIEVEKKLKSIKLRKKGRNSGN